MSNLAVDNSSWGTIFMGPERLRETTLSRLETGRSGPLWTEATEAEYFERVKSKAANKAREILEAAQAEAAAMRVQAHEQGYQQGLAEAQAELEEFRQAAGQTAAAVLSAIESQTDVLTSAWEDELCRLVRTAVEIGIGHELRGHRAEILEALFRDAVSALFAEQSAVVYANPEDEPVIADIIASAGDEHARRFQVRENPSLAPGSIVLESSLGLVENTIESRRILVENILNELALRERVEPERFASEAALHQQIEEVAQLEEELLAAPEIAPAQEVIAELPSDELAGHMSDVQETSLQNELDAETLLTETVVEGAEEITFAPEELGMPDEPEELGLLIPQDILNGALQKMEAAGEEQAVASSQPAPAQNTADVAAEAAPAEQEKKEMGQAESSQAAADAILDAMFEKGN